MANLDLRLVRIFNIIYKTRSLTGAAALLSVTQPSVSYALSQLRRQLDDPLFVRGPEGMVPTAKATELFEVFSRSVNQIDLAVEGLESFDPSTSSRTFRLCLSDLGELAFLPAVMSRLVAEAPGVALDVVPMQIDRVAEWLERGEVDAAIASVTLPGHARQEVIFRERYVCLLPARLDRGKEALTIEEFCALRHVLIDQSSGHSQADAALASRGVERRGSLRVHHFSVLPGVLANTDLVAIVPFRVAVLFRQLWPVAIKELPVEVQGFDVSLYWQDTMTRSKAHSWFRDLLSRALGDVDMLSGANGRPQA